MSNIALKLTFFRIAIIPIFVFALYMDDFIFRVLALLIFIIGMISDAYDGYFARKRNEITTLGAFLDPLADKLLISSALVSFVGIKELQIPAWIVVVIISREFIITGLRSIAATKNIIIPADKAGKFKTTTQSVIVIIILLIMAINAYISQYTSYPVTWQSILSPLPFGLMFFAAILTFYSGIRYIFKYKHLLK